MGGEGVCSTLDGNAVGGLLREVFAFDATVARTTCVGCARMVPMGELRLYAIELGAILRCPSCDEVVIRIGRTRRGLWLDLRGAATVAAVSAEPRQPVPPPSARRSRMPSPSVSRPRPMGRSR
jgi:Family of unknown function (DUF6510)